MVRRPHKRSDEIMLIPFLDILCSLIGVLVLIIVVLCVAQTQKIQGRTPEEISRAEEYLKMLKQQKENENINESLKDKVVKLERLQAEMKEKEERTAKLRKLLDSSNADREKNKEVAQNLMKELDNAIIEVKALGEQVAPLQKHLAGLQAEIKKRKPPANPGAPVIVQPGGSGLAKGAKVFFVEATAGKLTFYWDEKTKDIVSSGGDVLAVDVKFNAFLKAVKDVPQSKIIFLLRDDGMNAFNAGAGWAQETYGFRVDQVGKLPIPGRGEIDLKMFQEFLGSVARPPEATATPAPTPGKATPAPAKTTPTPATPKQAMRNRESGTAGREQKAQHLFLLSSFPDSTPHLSHG